MAEIFETTTKRVTLIDLSVCLSNDTSAFEPAPHKIEYLDAVKGLEMSQRWTGLGADYWPDGKAWVADTVSLASHSGTHVDAPSHYGPAQHGEARTIDQVPLRWCFSDGVVLNFADKPRGYGINAADVKAELGRIGYTLKPYDIVLIRTDTSKRFGERGYEMLHAGLRRSATEFLVDSGIKLIGIDAWGLGPAIGCDGRRSQSRPDAILGDALAGARERVLPDRETCQPRPNPPAIWVYGDGAASEFAGRQRRLVARCRYV